MSLHSRKPKTSDQELAELALMFKSPEVVTDIPTPGIELLDTARLDFTVESLELVDDYLEKMRVKTLDDEAAFRLVLRCGAYVGEVILRNATDKTYHWLDYKEALEVTKMLADFGESLGTVAVLWDSNTGLSFPMGKVVKFLENGREDSVHFFARAKLQKTVP
jgi:hypothetical protein